MGVYLTIGSNKIAEVGSNAYGIGYSTKLGVYFTVGSNKIAEVGSNAYGIGYSTKLGVYLQLVPTKLQRLVLTRMELECKQQNMTTTVSVLAIFSS